MSKETKLCEYGCGLEAKHQLKNGKWCCENFYTKCPENRRKNSETRKQQFKDGITKCNFVAKSLGRPHWSRGLTKETDERIKKRSEKMKLDYKNGTKTYKSHPHTQETREKLSQIQSERIKKMGSGGFKNIKWYYVKNHEDDSIVVRGKWELFVSELLNKHGIKWFRGNALKYKDQNNATHRYSPDFYLPDMDAYIEVKGYFSEKDKNKMNLTLQQNKVSIVLIDTFWYHKLLNNEITILEIPRILREKSQLFFKSNYANHALCPWCNSSKANTILRDFEFADGWRRGKQA